VVLACGTPLIVSSLLVLGIAHLSSPCSFRLDDAAISGICVCHVVFGHTHLAKQIDLGDGRTYTNTGTWADLAQIPFDEVMRMTDDELMSAIADFLAELRGPAGEHHWIKWLPYCAIFRVTEDGATPAGPRLVEASQVMNVLDHAL
jgi:hypothetical protein